MLIVMAIMMMGILTGGCSVATPAAPPSDFVLICVIFDSEVRIQATKLTLLSRQLLSDPTYTVSDTDSPSTRKAFAMLNEMKDLATVQEMKDLAQEFAEIEAPTERLSLLVNTFVSAFNNFADATINLRRNPNDIQSRTQFNVSDRLLGDSFQAIETEIQQYLPKG